MAGPDVKFTTKECRAMMKFLFLRGKTTKEIYDDMSFRLGKKSPSYSTVKDWVARFKRGHSSTDDDDYPGWPLVVTVPKNMNAIHSMIWANQRISAKKTAQTPKISRECVWFVIRMLDIRKLSANLVPKCLNEDEKNDRVGAASQEISEHFRGRAAGFFG